MKTSDFYFELPKEQIAQEPIADRSASRLMVLHRKTGEIEHRTFMDIVDYLRAGDCLVRNNTKVIPARLFGVREDTGAEILDELGQMPLPPYITHTLEDKNRYQTVYARYDGSAAAPTAGLHFTEELFSKIEEKGVSVANVTLHVGLGTFRPVKVDDVANHHMHSEHYFIEPAEAEKINRTKREGGRVICVGTTSCRTVESAAEQGMVRAAESDTQIFIYPGYRFQVMDELITNFHLPESTLLMLVSALAGREFVLRAYEEAVREGYRFFSFGDAMLITD